MNTDLKKLVLMMMVAGTLACSPSMKTELMGVADQGSNDGQSSETPTEGDGSLVIDFIQPTSRDLPTQIFKVEIGITSITNVREVKLFANDKLVRNFTRSPFILDVDPRTYPGDQIVLRVETKDLGQKANSRVITLKKPSITDPGGNPGSGSSRDAGVFDSNCLNNSAFDACVFWKNPVAQRGQAYSRTLTYGDNIQEQTFGVKLTGLINNELKNSSIRVLASNGQTAQISGGHWRFDWKTDLGKHYVAQLMAYFWLQFQEMQMLARTGEFFAKNKNIPVDAYNTSVANNAYWDTQKIVMGGVKSGSNFQHEMAMSAEVYLHEMGHANLQFAVGGFLRDGNAGSQGTCRTEAGCLYAINEGQADFHFLMLFPEATAMGESWVNNMNGLSQQGIPRDPKRNHQYKIGEFFSASSGAIHTMGSAYASIFWTIYNDPRMLKNDFEKMFTRHLQGLTESSRFPEAKEILLADDETHFASKYRQVINEAFAARDL
jgi:hypothetical protein